MMNIRHVIEPIFNYDFSRCKTSSSFIDHFFGKTLAISDLKILHDALHASHVTLGGKEIYGVCRLGPQHQDAPIAILAQLHGNEPAGLAGILLACALAEAGMLTRPLLAVIGNPLASQQYFSVYTEAPRARQEMRDAYRCGLAEGGVLLPDLNRIPVDAMTRKADTPHLKRAQELLHLGQHISGILDIHSARGNMLCVTDHKNNRELKNAPIRAVLIGLAEAISAHSSSGNVTVQTLKTMLAPLPNIQHQVGIEAGRHEQEDTLLHAAMFTHSFLHNVGATQTAPYIAKKETGMFDCYHVHPKWTYGDLRAQGEFGPEDKIYMVTPCLSADGIPKRSDRVVVKKKDGGYQVQTIMQYIVQPAGSLAYAVYQYDEMEMLQESAVVAVAVPSGVTLKAPASAAGIFFSKSGALYDKDPNVGPWPVTASTRHEVKFCYPCSVKKEKLEM